MSDLEKFASVSMRGPRKGIWEQLAAAKLVKANRTGDPLQRVLSICEAARFARDRVKNPEIDYGVVDRLFDVATALFRS